MINYTPSTNTGSLLYPLEQITLSISNIRLKVLNSSPWELLPLGFNYNVTNAYLNYDAVNFNTGINLFIGYESFLGANVFSSFCDFDTSAMSIGNGNIGLGTRVRNFSYANSTNSEPLVLWQQSDDGTANYNTFELTITYLKFP